MKSRVFFICLMCLVFSSCMNTEIYPRKEYKEVFPVYLNDNIFISNVYFNNIYQSKFLLLWNLEFRYVNGKGIGTFIYYDSSYFPLGTSVKVNKIRIIMRDKSEIVCSYFDTFKESLDCVKFSSQFRF